MLYFKYARIALRGQLANRGAFLALAAGQFFVPFLAFAGLLALFGRFGAVAGFSLPELLLCFALTHLAFSLTECFARGFDEFPQVLSSGEFDRILVRPRGLVLQVLGARFEFSRVGRLAVAVGALCWALPSVGPGLDLLRALALVEIVAGGIVLFSGIFLAGAAFSFWTTDGLEVLNILTDGGREMGQYPLGIYPEGARAFFTFVVPFGCVNWYPLCYALGRPGFGEWALLTPCAAILFFLPCLALWRAGLRRHSSTGS